MMTIFLEDSFDAAHWLPNVSEHHKCHRMHGHTYRVRLEVSGEIDAVMGWVVDYSELKRLWGPVKAALDHHCLNDFMPNPTCEIIARWIGNNIELVSRIELRETVNCGVIWTREG
jgi:6-pyruvoyltetrahydropterin/6-carboxytetrahydropterin synthase